MENYVVPAEEVFVLLGELMKSQDVMGVRERTDQPGFYLFDWLRTPEELVLEYVTTTLPPKKAFSAPNETLFRFRLDDPPALRQQMFDDRSFLLAGVHPCDLAAIRQLDFAYSQSPAEARWTAHRQRATIIGIDCMPDEYCFCASVGTCDAHEPCDFFLTRVDRGYLVEVHAADKSRMLEGISKYPARSQDLEAADRWRRKKREQLTAQFTADVDELAAILARGGLFEIWQEIAGRCYSCGSCNTTCPTCFCFDIADDLDASLAGGVRRRSWDSCQLLDFARVAGGHNFRADRWQRVRHRWHRKFLYLYKQFGSPYCTGCGRCSRACTADINIVDVTNSLISYSRRTQDFAAG